MTSTEFSSGIVPVLRSDQLYRTTGLTLSCSASKSFRQFAPRIDAHFLSWDSSQTTQLSGMCTTRRPRFLAAGR